MADMLVKLYDLPPEPSRLKLDAEGITIRRALSLEKHAVMEWVREKFGGAWASECDVSFAAQPPGCFIAVKDRQVIGFACCEATCKGFFGPTGVDDQWRGRGIGTHLLIVTLQAMKDMGYAYAIIGGVGPVEFYAKTAGAVLIEDSSPGIYRDLLKV
jgi:GNAT superfamily N-acetyltransferase